MPPEKDPLRLAAQDAAAQQLRLCPANTDAALRAYLATMVAGRIDAAYPSSRPGTATRITIEDANGGLVRAVVDRGSPQASLFIGMSLEGLVNRLNDKFFPTGHAARVSFQGAQIDVKRLQPDVAVLAGQSATR